MNTNTSPFDHFTSANNRLPDQPLGVVSHGKRAGEVDNPL